MAHGLIGESPSAAQPQPKRSARRPAFAGRSHCRQIIVRRFGGRRPGAQRFREPTLIWDNPAVPGLSKLLRPGTGRAPQTCAERKDFER